jgi:carboxypeptidase T
MAIGIKPSQKTKINLEEFSLSSAKGLRNQIKKQIPEPSELIGPITEASGPSSDPLVITERGHIAVLDNKSTHAKQWQYLSTRARLSGTGVTLLHTKFVVAAASLLAMCMILTTIPGGAFVAAPDASGADAQEPVAAAEPQDGALSAPVQPEVDVGNTSYHSYGEMVAELKKNAVDHPSTMMLTSIGKTTQGRDIWAVKVSDNPQVEESGEPEIYFNFAHHSREWVTIEFALLIINYLTDNYGSNPTVTGIVNSRQVWLIPCVNADGRVLDGYVAGDDPLKHGPSYQGTYDYGWRKNVRDNNADSQFVPTQDGVDLNRNYGYAWGGAGASASPTYDTYGGPYAFSEPETRAVRDFVRQHSFKLAISYHTAASMILYPEGWNWIGNKDTTILRSLANGLADRITNTVGDPQARYTPQQSSQLYTTTGSDDDWLYGEMGIFAFCIEMAPSQSYTPVAPYDDNFHPNPTQMTAICNDNLPAAVWFCQIADNPYQIIDSVKVQPTATEMRVRAGTVGTLPINILNDGRRATDTYTLTPTLSTGWAVSMSPSPVSVARNATVSTTLRVTVPAGATPGTYRIWMNATSGANVTCKNMSYVNLVVTYGKDVSCYLQSPFVEQGTYPMGIYGIKASVKNVGNTSIGGFPTYCNITRMGTTSNRVLFSDNMESGTTKWVTRDYDGTVTTNYWHQVTTSSHSATRSWYCGPTTPGTYSNNAVQIIEMANPVSLRTATGANLTLWTSYSLAVTVPYYYDFITVDGSRNNGASWEYITRYTNAATIWTNRTVNLGNFTGVSEFKLRLRFSSDGSGASTGFYFDDVFITAQVPSEAKVYGDVVQITPSLAVNGTAVVSGWSYNFNAGGRYRVTTWTANSTDNNQANNATSVVITIDGTKTFPVFAGVDRVTNTATGTSLNASWNPVTTGNAVTYRLMCFDHSPTQAEIAIATNVSGPMNAYVYDGAAQSWIHGGLGDGTTYYYVCRAHDSYGNWDWNTVVKSALAESLLFFQTQSPLGGYKGLNTLPFEGGIQSSVSASMSAVGQYKVADSWITDAYMAAQDASGEWKFRVNAMSDYKSAGGFLYAKVYRYNGGSPVLMFQTGNDDENVASYAGAYHEYFWTYAAGSSALPAGDRFYVEIWMDCSSATPGASSVKYTLTGSTQLGGPHHAWFGDNDDLTEFELTTPNSVVEFTNTYYPNAGVSDNTYAGPCTAPGTGDEIFVKYSMAVSENPSTVTQIRLTHEARHSAGAAICTLFTFNQTSQAWDQVGTTMTFTTLNTDYNMTRDIMAGCSNYISGGILLWGVYESVSNLQVSVDLAQAIVTYSLPAVKLTFGYDNGLAPSSVHPSLTSSTTATFDIPVVAGWNLISEPIAGPTAMPSALIDTVNGGAGLVQWTRAMWYNPATPLDPWKQYNTAWAPPLNDLTNVDRTMGVWLYVTTVGDGAITVGGAGYSVPISTAINLRTGWNLIGFPSDDVGFTVAMLKLACPSVTIVERYNGAQTYLTSVMGDAETLVAGRGYWVYSSSDTVWNKPY